MRVSSGSLKVLGAVALITTLGVAGNKPTGLCTYQDSTGGLTRASCTFPSCPVGVDCDPPTIDKSSASIAYEEPILQWKATCPDANITGPCWEVKVGFTFQLAANDDSGVQAVGVHLVHEVSARRTFLYKWGNVGRESGPKFSMGNSLVTHVPPGGRLDIAVYELCARDGMNNEGCVFPLNAHALDFSLNN